MHYEQKTVNTTKALKIATNSMELRWQKSKKHRKNIVPRVDEAQLSVLCHRTRGNRFGLLNKRSARRSNIWILRNSKLVHCFLVPLTLQGCRFRS